MSDDPSKHDIDFDELDKAVHSLMGKVGSETLEDDDKTKTLDINATLKADEKPSYDALGKAAQTIGDETLVTDSEVELVEDLSKLSDTMQLPVPTAGDEKPAEPVQAADRKPVPAVKRPNSGRFMDMVHPNADMRSAAPPANLAVPSRSSAPAVITAPTSPTLAAGKPAAPAVPAPDAPLTPFLPDAKVEKRPLGSAAPTGENSPTSVSDEKPDAENDAQHVLDPIDFQKESPNEEELSKIAAIEANDNDSLTIEKVESGDTEHLKSPAKPAGDDKPGEGTIYDMENYHQPISHPPKQKSGWGTVLIIILIIVLAIALGGGAYLYFGMK